MKIPPFKLERYFAKYEFSAPYLLSCLDCEPLTLNELLSTSDDESLKLWEDLWLGYTESQGHPLSWKHLLALRLNWDKPHRAVHRWLPVSHPPGRPGCGRRL